MTLRVKRAALYRDSELTLDSDMDHLEDKHLGSDNDCHGCPEEGEGPPDFM
jgi:DNA primase catalytic subunit